MRSLSALRREHPGAHARLCEVLSGSTLALEIDGERLTLSFGRAEIQTADLQWADVTFRADRRVLLSLLEGRTSLFEAAVAGEAVVSGAPGALVRFHDGLLAFLFGALRAPTFPSLLRELREQASRERDRTAPARVAHVE